MKSLKNTLQESLRIGINDNPYTASPTKWDELRQIIEERFKEFGPGTENEPIDFNDIDVSGMTTFFNDPSGVGLFEGTLFEYIDVSNWDVSKVKDMNSLFRRNILESVGDLSNWNVSSAEDIGYIFYECKYLKSVGDLSNWNVSKIKNMSWIFYTCEKLKSLGDLSNWNVSNVENMNGMFTDCTKLKSVGDLSNWDVSNVQYMRYMFTDSGITNIPDWYKG